jgi:hypothetical protein
MWWSYTVAMAFLAAGHGVPVSYSSRVQVSLNLLIQKFTYRILKVILVCVLQGSRHACRCGS